MSEKENWKPVVGFEGLYEVSDQGRVRSLNRVRSNGRFYPSKILSPPKRGRYLKVSLISGGVHFQRSVHRLVLEAFVGPAPEDKPFGLHLNDIPTDNRLENLRWGNASENKFDEIRNGNNFARNKIYCPQGHKLSGSNLSASDLRLYGFRKCRICLNQRRRHYP